MLDSSPVSGAEIPSIIHVDAVSNGAESKLQGQLVHHVEKLVLAVIAAMSVVAGILGPVQFKGLNDLDGNPVFFGKFQSMPKLGSGQAGRISYDREHITI